MLLDIEPRYSSCNEIYFGEGEGSASASHCCVMNFKIAECNGPRIIGGPIARQHLLNSLAAGLRYIRTLISA